MNEFSDEFSHEPVLKDKILDIFSQVFDKREFRGEGEPEECSHGEPGFGATNNDATDNGATNNDATDNGATDSYTKEKNDKKKKKIFLDCTLGLAGHSRAILEAFDVKLVGIDRDEDAIKIAASRLAKEPAGQVSVIDSIKNTTENDPIENKFLNVVNCIGSDIVLVRETFNHLSRVLDELDIKTVDGVLFDFGMSSMQIDDISRGFSYSKKSPLDMRMNKNDELTAFEIVNSYSQEELTRLFKKYGEERHSKLIARKIVEARKYASIKYSDDLIRVIKSTGKYRNKKDLDGACKRVFQALRICVNDELLMIVQGLTQAIDRLSVGGVIITESYQSLEDKLSKKIFECGFKNNLSSLPFDVEEQKPFLEPLVKNACKASDDEVEKNPRSHSVRLRAMRKIGDVNDYAKQMYGALKKEFSRSEI